MKTKLYLSFLALTALPLSVSSVQAQTYQPSNRTPVSDNTLGTQVLGNGGNFNITGGVRKGQTLFHSFNDFSVPTNGQANFLNPFSNRDIITRVTGNLFSDINGTVNTNGANFFLINPNGIVFGPNAQLNVGKAFVGSTANSIDLVDGGGRTITFGTNPNGDAPLLAVNPNVFFNVSRLNLGGGTGAISNFGTLQTPNDSQYIGLIGGNVNMNGGKIIAPGGRVDIGGLSSAGTVTVDNSELVFGGNGLERSNVLLTNGAGITVRATGTLSPVNTFFNNATSNGSSINISANNLDILNSGAKSSTQPAAIDAGLDTNSGVQTAAAGDININATGKVTLDNSAIKNTLRSGAEGKIGDIKIQANALDIKNQSIISTQTTGKGNAGNIDIKTTGDLTLSGTNDPALLQGNSTTPLSSIDSSTDGQGNAGKITIDTKGNLSLTNKSAIISNINTQGTGDGQGISINVGNLSLSNNSSIQSINFGKGNAGNIDIKTTGDLTLSGTIDPTLLGDSTTILSYIESSTGGQGNAGKITIDAINGNLLLDNKSGIFANINTQGTGDGQGISINVGNLSLSNNSSIQSINFGKGNAGNIDIKTTENFSINTSNISSSTYGQGNTGKIVIDTKGDITLGNESSIESRVSSEGNGNSQGIIINANNLNLFNDGRVLSDTLGKGNAGNVDIKTTGDIIITGTKDLSIPQGSLINLSGISSSTYGQGNAGKITIDAKGNISLANRGVILSAIDSKAIGNSQGISITAKNLDLVNSSFIASNNFGGKGDAGNVDIKTTENLTVNTSDVSSSTNGQGNAGKITIDAKGNISLANQATINSSIDTQGNGNGQGISISTRNLSVLNNSKILSNNSGKGNTGKITIDAKENILLTNGGVVAATIDSKATGNIQGISITAKNLDLVNSSAILSNNLGGKGDAGNIDIKTTENLNVNTSNISSTTYGQGNTGKIVIDTKGDITLANESSIESRVSSEGNGNSQGIIINANNLNLLNGGSVLSDTLGKGNAGNVDIKTTGGIIITGTNNLSIPQGDLINSSAISSSTFGQGNAGKITIDAKGNISLANQGVIFSLVDSEATGNSQGISITAKDLILFNKAFIASNTFGKGNAGNIDIKTTGDLLIIGTIDRSLLQGDLTTSLSRISTSTSGEGNAGKIAINAKGNVSLLNRSKITSSNNSEIESSDRVEKYSAGDIIINSQGSIDISNLSYIGSDNFGQGKAANIIITSDRMTLNKGGISAESIATDGVTGGNIDITLKDKLILRNNACISTNCQSKLQNANGGNITINSPLIVALPGDSNITANATGGKGGNINITSQGIFGIQYRPNGQNSPLTNDITASSTFGRDGAVNISTPGVDPGKDSTELPKVTTDASNQISQVCSATNRQNKLTVAGRGGLPPTANDPLTSDVIWQDARAASRQPAVSTATIHPVELAPPAVGWVFNGKKVTLIAAKTNGEPTGTSVACPNIK